MAKIIFISGTCGSGKSTVADALARHLVRQDHRTRYVIHGDDFHKGFVEQEGNRDLFTGGRPADRVQWEDILKFNWDCIIATADRALQQDLDVVIDYVIEDELPRVRELAARQPQIRMSLPLSRHFTVSAAILQLSQRWLPQQKTVSR